MTTTIIPTTVDIVVIFVAAVVPVLAVSVVRIVAVAVATELWKLIVLAY